MRWAIGTYSAVIVVHDSMQHHPLAIVETDSQQTVLPLRLIFDDDDEQRIVGLRDLQWHPSNRFEQEFVIVPRKIIRPLPPMSFCGSPSSSSSSSIVFKSITQCNSVRW